MPKPLHKDWKTRLTTKPLGPGGKPPMFAFDVYNNNPSFSVFPNFDNGSGVSMIRGGMDASIFCQIMEAIRWFGTDKIEIGTTWAWENKKDIPKEQIRDPKIRKETISRTLLGKDKNGVWIGLEDMRVQNAPKVQFHFGSNLYHPGNMDRFQWSCIAAIGWANMAEKVAMDGIIMAPVLDPASDGTENGGKSSGNGFGGGKPNYGGNKGGYNKGGYNKGGSGGGGQPKSYGQGGSGGDTFGGADGGDEDWGGDGAFG